MYNQRPAKFLQIISFVVLVGWVAAMLVVARLFYINRPLAAYLLQENGPFEIIGFFFLYAGRLFISAHCLFAMGFKQARSVLACRACSWISVPGYGRNQLGAVVHRLGNAGNI